MFVSCSSLNLRFPLLFGSRQAFQLAGSFFDQRPGKVGDEDNNLIRRVRGCYLKIEGDGQEVTVPVWRSTVLELPQTREDTGRQRA
jgi:hypothetical protein